MTTSRRTVAAAFAAVPLLLTGCGNQSSSAICVAPQVSASPTSVHAGQKLHVTGRWFHSGCDDVVTNGQTSDTQRPLVGLTVRLQEGSSAWELARGVKATTRNGMLDLLVTVPAEVRPGPATLTSTGPDVGLTPSAALSVQAGS